MANTDDLNKKQLEEALATLEEHVKALESLPGFQDKVEQYRKAILNIKQLLASLE